MHISKHADYSLRTLMYLAAQPAESLSSIAEVSEYFKVSHNHMMKVVNRLAQGGYVEAIRGKGGGIRLGRDPAQINVGELIASIECATPVVNCDEGPCRYRGNCRLKGALDEAVQAFTDSLSRYSLADLLSGAR